MKTIMIIEDDPAIRDSAELIFDPALYHTEVMPHAEAILQGQYTVPDIFIIDRQLPGVDGLDICRHLRAKPATRRTPIIIMSASPSASQQALSAGADDFIEKPYSIHHIRALVQRYLST